MSKIIVLKIKEFIKNKKGSDDKNAGSAMSMITSVVIGFLILTAIYSFFNQDFLPSLFQKITDAINYSG